MNSAQTPHLVHQMWGISSRHGKKKKNQRQAVPNGSALNRPGLLHKIQSDSKYSRGAAMRQRADGRTVKLGALHILRKFTFAAPPVREALSNYCGPWPPNTNRRTDFCNSCIPFVGLSSHNIVRTDSEQTQDVTRKGKKNEFPTNLWLSPESNGSPYVTLYILILTAVDAQPRATEPMRESKEVECYNKSRRGLIKGYHLASSS
jgi:hypothetical protein